MLALNLPLAIRSSDERTENTCKFWILAAFMWYVKWLVCRMYGIPPRMRCGGLEYFG
jgi:hypothetical protein